MTQISKHFTRREFACKCGCGQDTVDAETLEICEKVRAHFDEPTTVHSGNRCPEYNRRVGGAKSSQHLISRAADISVRNTPPSEVADYIETILEDGGLGRYPTFTHLDSRTGPRARW